MNAFMSWLKDRLAIEKKSPEYKAKCKHLAFIASSGCDLRKAYRVASQKDAFFISENGVSTQVSYESFRKRSADLKPIEDRGGIITFSSNITHKTVDGERVPVSSLRERLFAKIKSLINRWTAPQKVDQAVKSINQPVGYSLGNFFSGRYVDGEGNVFDEKSTSLDILNISSDNLYKIAKELCNEFNQNSVMIYDRNKNQYYEYENDNIPSPSDDEPWKLNPDTEN